MKLGCLISVTVMLAAASTQAAVLTNTIMATNSGLSIFRPFYAEWEISTTAEDASISGDYTLDRKLIATNQTTGVSHNWFSVDEGTAFTPSYAAMATPFSPFSEIPDGGILMPTRGESFYLGVALGNAPEPGTHRLGWVELQHDGFELTALSSATDDSGRGLIVGTLTVVPEPSATILAILAFGSMIARRRKGA